MLNRQEGFTLIEVLLALAIVAIAIPALIQAYAFGFATVSEGRMIEVASSIAQMAIEEQLAAPVPYPIATTPFPGMPGYQYTVTTATTEDGMTCITVTVTYHYLGRERSHKVVALR